MCRPRFDDKGLGFFQRKKRLLAESRTPTDRGVRTVSPLTSVAKWVLDARSWVYLLSAEGVCSEQVLFSRHPLLPPDHRARVHRVPILRSARGATCETWGSGRPTPQGASGSGVPTGS